MFISLHITDVAARAVRALQIVISHVLYICTYHGWTFREAVSRKCISRGLEIYIYIYNVVLDSFPFTRALDD